MPTTRGQNPFKHGTFKHGNGWSHLPDDVIRLVMQNHRFSLNHRMMLAELETYHIMVWWMIDESPVAWHRRAPFAKLMLAEVLDPSFPANLPWRGPVWVCAQRCQPGGVPCCFARVPL